MFLRSFFTGSDLSVWTLLISVYMCIKERGVPMIELKHLGKTYETSSGSVTALRDIDLTIQDGEIFGVIGLSGAGKSTLVRCINLLETPSSGEILYHGRDVAGRGVNAPEYRSHVGMVFQSFNLFNNMSVLKNCMVGQMKVLKRSKEEARQQALKYLEKVGMAPYINAKPRQISGGQKQRVAIAGVVAMRPDCLILDEATAMLDPRGREQVMQTIHYLNRNMGITVVSITHYMEEAAQADRVLVMSKGHVVMEGTPKEVFSQTEKVRSLHLDVPQAAELRDELVKAGIPMPEGIIDTGACAQALYELLQ